MSLKLEINNGGGYLDYTQYVLPESISVEDSLNVPTLLTFTLANNDNNFVVPVRSAYCRLSSSKFNLPIATGFVTAAPSRTYLGLGNNIPAFNFQRYTYDIQVTSDEWLINVKTVPFLPPFVNLGQGQILAQLAERLVPNFFDTTSFVASGDLVPDFPYDPTQNWSDLAKQFADGSRFRYKVLDRVIYFQPYGDGPLGVTYDETKGEATFYPNLMQTPVQSVPPCNDAIVIGDVEAQNNHEDYFVGDGVTGNFPLRYSMFEGASSLLINEPWTGSGVNSSLWTVFDPSFAISEQGGGLQLQGGDGIGSTYIMANSGIELGGAVNIQVGDFQFVDVCDGIVGGMYSDATFTQDKCIAGFQLGSNPVGPWQPNTFYSTGQIILDPNGDIEVVAVPGTSGPITPTFNTIITGTTNDGPNLVWENIGPPEGGTTVVPTASGAIGVTMQPMLFGVPVGPIVVSQENHSYFLQIYFSCNTWSRYDRPYRTLVGNVFGNVRYGGVGTVTFIVSDTSIDAPNNPTITQFSQAGLTLPEFALFAPINANNLNLALTNTLVGLPPQGGLYVRSLYGPTANQFPVDPPGPEIQYLLGFGFQNQVATINTGSTAGSPNDINELQFYASSYQTLVGATLPAVGSRIKLQAWEAGVSLARVQDPVAIAAEAKIVGDDGHRTAVFKTLNPIPRTSSECDAAGAAIIQDRSGVQYEGTYTFYDWFFDGTMVWNPVVGALAAGGYPVPGRYLIATAPERGINNLKLLVRRVTLKVVELRQETLNVVVDFGPDYYLDKMLNKFIEDRVNVFTPTDATNPPTPQQLETIGEFYLTNLDNATVKGLITGRHFTIDFGVQPASGIEVRKADQGWTQKNRDLLYTVTNQQITLPRKANEEIYFLRMVNGPLYSRFSKVIRLLYPLVPHPPPDILLDCSVPTAPVIRVQLPINTDRNIYGVQIDRGFEALTPCQQVTVSSSDPLDTRFVDITGILADGTQVTDTVQLNGINPVTTPDTFCALVSMDINPKTVVFVNDTSGQTWEIDVEPDGAFKQTQTAAQTPPLIFLNDTETNSITYQIGMTVAGNITTTPVVFILNQPQSFALTDSTGVSWNVQVHTNGQLFTA